MMRDRTPKEAKQEKLKLIAIAMLFKISSLIKSSKNKDFDDAYEVYHEIQQTVIDAYDLENKINGE